MNSQILQLATPYVRTLLLVFAFLALLRGHNHPGGGFIAGLLASLSVVFNCYAYSVRKVREKLKIQPAHYMGAGLFLLLLSVLPGLIWKGSLMEGVWYTLTLRNIAEIKLGTPLLFDIGVFLTVIGVTLQFLFTLTSKD